MFEDDTLKFGEIELRYENIYIERGDYYKSYSEQF